MRTLSRVAFGAAFGATAMAAGCDGASHSEFVSKANRICSEANATPVSQSKTIQDVARNGPNVVAADNRQVSRLRSLDVPAKDKPAFDEFLRLLDNVTALAKSETAAATRNDVEGLRAIDPQLATKAKEASAAALKAGLRSCVQ